MGEKSRECRASWIDEECGGRLGGGSLLRFLVPAFSAPPLARDPDKRWRAGRPKTRWAMRDPGSPKGESGSDLTVVGVLGSPVPWTLWADRLGRPSSSGSNDLAQSLSW